ncbi:hypothetical protein [Streptomyces sp. NBC_01803]|uniref:hypothetical protein n=1 Tax=Streptomyces sp. NBC_01803 TaxID=2975946 RepID=UPI002DDC20FE|nr:hypothetical protein [Streptomyces sp. NBC_01803]WSA45395.1 hypothetical protein OIE51_14980 [Streptomyces sp. NBC_01803]
MSRSIDDVLARAVLAHRPHTYSEQEIEAAEARIAARIADRVPRQQRGAGARPGRDAEAAGQLRILCRTVVEQEGALQHLAAFLARRIPYPDGARVLGCVLQLAGREDSARFWWQYAAGAGDAAAAYCLYLHHTTLGERWEAELWYRQADGAGDGDRQPTDGSSPALVLRVLTLLRGDRAYLTEAAAAVVHYVPDAVQFVDEIELPLPAADFVERIEELTAAG